MRGVGIVVRSIASLAAASTLAACAADDEEEVRVDCSSGTPVILAGLRDRVAYAALVQVIQGAVPQIHVLEEIGSKCAGAPDAAACAADLDRLTRESSGVALVGTDARGAFVVRTRQEAAARLGRIDTGEEALLVLAVEGRIWSCGELQRIVRDEQGVVIESPRRCADGTKTARTRVSSDGRVQELGTEGGCAVEGRRFEGLPSPGPLEDEDALGAFFARAAYFEAASVRSFDRLAAELDALGAPRSLVESARRASVDEIRHARVMAALARSRGVRVPRVPRAPKALRRARDVALENVVEGCVHETWAAVVALIQAERASDAALRSAMARIAEDEIAHAELAHRVRMFFDAFLGPSDRRAVDEAFARALDALVVEVASPSAVDRVASEAGVPTADERPRLARALRRRLAA